MQASRMSRLRIRDIVKPNIDVVQEEQTVTQVSLRSIDSCVQEGAILALAPSGNHKMDGYSTLCFYMMVRMRRVQLLVGISCKLATCFPR